MLARRGLVGAELILILVLASAEPRQRQQPARDWRFQLPGGLHVAHTRPEVQSGRLWILADVGRGDGPPGAGRCRHSDADTLRAAIFGHRERGQCEGESLPMSDSQSNQVSGMMHVCACPSFPGAD